MNKQTKNKLDNQQNNILIYNINRIIENIDRLNKIINRETDY